MGSGDKKRHHGKQSELIFRVTPPCGHEHHALFRLSNTDCVLNLASAKRAGSETCATCVPPGGAKNRLKPRKCWNTKKSGWKVEDMPKNDEEDVDD